MVVIPDLIYIPCTVVLTVLVWILFPAKKGTTAVCFMLYFFFFCIVFSILYSVAKYGHMTPIFSIAQSNYISVYSGVMAFITFAEFMLRLEIILRKKRKGLW